jgi:Do/DeqQ family serine protease
MDRTRRELVRLTGVNPKQENETAMSVWNRWKQVRWGWYAAALVLAGAFAAGYYYRDQQRTAAAPLYLKSALADAPGVPPGGFADVVKKTAPAVVNVYTTTEVKRTQTRRMQSPFDFFFEGPFGGEQPTRPRKQQGLGSGVIMSADGYIITNNHVIDGATQVKIQLRDKREFDAKIVGGDKLSDIAVLKVEGSGLPVLPVGNSDRIDVGDLTLAIGNPFGVGQTVTMGIVSATGRRGFSFGEGPQIEDFIQTDASINRGNSGGALVNSRGELIGINSAIITPSGASAGIGFAIPVNMARDVMTQLVKNGKVARGYLGVGIQDLDEGLAKEAGLPNSSSGALVNSVTPGGPAEKAGVRRYDVITAVEGAAVSDREELVLRVSRIAPGTTVKLKVRRDGKDETVPVVLGTRPDDLLAQGSDTPDSGSKDESLAGVRVQPLSPDIVRQFRIPDSVEGVAVVDVDEDSAAAESGLRPGDVISRVNRQAVTSVSEYNRAVSAAANRTVVLEVTRGRNTFLIGIQPKR